MRYVHLTFSILLAVCFCFPLGVSAQTFVGDGSGLFNIHYLSTTGTNPGNDTNNWLSVWNAIDGGATGTGIIGGFNVNNNFVDTEVAFNYPGGGNFGGDFSLASINMNGPGGGGGATQGDNYSIRGQTILEFTVGGTYTIAMGSDDGRRIELSEFLPGSAPGYTGFTARGGQVNDGAWGENNPFQAGDDVVGFSGGTGHNQSVGTFSVAAGDILALDAFYYEGGGGDSGEISLAQGAQGGFNGSFQLLQDSLFGGEVLLHTAGTFVPEPASLVLWGLVGFGLAGFAGYRRLRRKGA